MRCAPRARSGGAAPRAHAEHLSINRMADVRPGVQQVTAQRNGPLRLPESYQSPAQSVGDAGWRRGMGTRSSWVVRSVCRTPARPSVQPGNASQPLPASACEPGAAMRQPGRMRRTADGGRRGDQRASEHKPCRGEPTCPGQVRTCLSVRVRRTPHQKPTHLPRRSGDLLGFFPRELRLRLHAPTFFDDLAASTSFFPTRRSAHAIRSGLLCRSLLSIGEFDRSIDNAEQDQNGRIEFPLESK